MNMASLLISLLITATAYLLIPVILILSKRKYTKSMIRTIAVSNASAVFIIFAFLELMVSGSAGSNFAPALIWGSIGHTLLQRFSLGEEPPKPVDPEEAALANAVMVCKKCGYDGEYPGACPKCGSYARKNISRGHGYAVRYSARPKAVPGTQRPAAPVTPAASRPRYCGSCGGLLPPDTKFCPECGKRV